MFEVVKPLIVFGTSKIYYESIVHNNSHRFGSRAAIHSMHSVSFCEIVSLTATGLNDNKSNKATNALSN